MSELIAHEVEVAAVDGSEGHETYHLMEGNAPAGNVVLVALLEMPVHIGIYQAEDDGLVAHEGLVVALAVGDGFLVRAAVLHLPEDAAHVDILIAHLLDGLDPVVGDVHGHPVVEAIAAVLKACSKAWHSRHLLGDGDGAGVHFVDELVGEREIADGVVVLVAVEIVAVARKRLTKTVGIVEHGGDTIEAEAVEMELLQPVFAVGEQEMDDVILAVVEAEGVPGRMLVAVAGIEILVGVAS